MTTYGKVDGKFPVEADMLITPRVKLVEPGNIPATEGEAIRVIDNRKEQ